MNYYLPDNIEEGALGGTGNLKLYGNELDNFMHGNAGDNVFNIGLGNEFVGIDQMREILMLSVPSIPSLRVYCIAKGAS